jgi:hypothetical protein
VARKPSRCAAFRAWELASTRRPRPVRPRARRGARRRAGAVDCEVAIVEVDHCDARAHEPRESEHRDACAEREGGIGVTQVVEVAWRIDPGRPLDRLPVAAVEVAEVEVSAACVRKEQRAVVSWPKLVEGLERDRLKRNSASAQPRLRVLDPSICVGPSHLHDAGGTIDVTVFEREQLGGSKPGRGREHDHRPEARSEPLGERPDLRPGIERPLLPAAPARIR